MTKSSKWLSILTGIFYILTAFYFIFNPLANLEVLSWLLSLLFFVGSLSNLLTSYSLPSEARRGHSITGILSLLFAVYLLFYGYATLPIVIPTALGLWLIVNSAIQLFQAMKVREELPLIKNYLTWTGILGLVFGLVLFFNPLIASVTVVYLLATVFLYQGVTFIHGALTR